MKLLLDTHVLLWAAAGEGLPPLARARLTDPRTQPLFSAASIWEVAIKAALGRPDFSLDAAAFRRELLDAGYDELAIDGVHAAAAGRLPDLHRDPFDRILVAQATIEGLNLVTADRAVLAYAGPIIALEALT